MTFTLNVTALLQIAAWGSAFLAQLLDAGVIPDRWKRGFMLVAFALSLVLHRFAGTHNSNGTPEALPYSPITGELLSAAEAAYESYRAQAGGKSLTTGTQLPAWSSLMPAIQQAWTAAAAAAKVHEAA
ncbi:MAG: hypothetical protein WDO73_25220 [Ignavibacteriota bacterium]